MPKPTLTLEARDQQIAALAAAGVRQGEIARRLGVHRNSVGRRLRQAQVQARIGEIRHQVQRQAVLRLTEHIEHAASQAGDRLTALLEHGSPHTVFRVAQFILDCGLLRGTRGAAPRQGQGTPLPREDSQLDPYCPIQQALDQPQAETGLEDLHQWAMQHAQAMAQDQGQQGQHRAEAPPLTQEPAPALPSPGAAMPREQEPDPVFYAAQEERWRARLEELKRWPV